MTGGEVVVVVDVGPVVGSVAGTVVDGGATGVVVAGVVVETGATVGVGGAVSTDDVAVQLTATRATTTKVAGWGRSAFNG